MLQERIYEKRFFLKWSFCCNVIPLNKFTSFASFIQNNDGAKETNCFSEHQTICTSNINNISIYKSVEFIGIRALSTQYKNKLVNLYSIS